MDKKSKIILWGVFILIAASVAFLFDEYIIRKDFSIMENDSGIPEILE